MNAKRLIQKLISKNLLLLVSSPSSPMECRLFVLYSSRETRTVRQSQLYTIKLTANRLWLYDVNDVYGVCLTDRNFDFEYVGDCFSFQEMWTSSREHVRFRLGARKMRIQWFFFWHTLWKNGKFLGVEINIHADYHKKKTRIRVKIGKRRYASIYRKNDYTRF